MTPTEQDKELADTIFLHLDGLSAVVSINHTTNRKGYVERRKRDGFIVYKTRDELLQLIIADRKRVALEARLDENNMYIRELTRHYFPSSPSEPHIPLVQFHERITELKAQQEELWLEQ